MDTQETAERTAPSGVPAEPAPKPRPGEPKPEESVPSIPSSGLEDDSLEGLGVASSGLSVEAPEGTEKEKGPVDMGVEEKDPRDEHHPSEEVPFDQKSSESAPSASDYLAPPSPKTTKLQATHPATSSPLHVWL